MLSENEQSWLFLREFTREILTNIGNMYLRQELRKEIREKLVDVLKNKDRILEEIESRDYPPKISVENSKNDFNNKLDITNEDLVVVKPKVVSDVVNKKPDVVVNSDLKLNIGKVNDLFNDNEIYSVECPGPNKFLISKKLDKVDISPITLSEDEIKKVIGEFSRLTKIYPTEGVFDVTYKNYSITAVMSDLAGSRFVITRYVNPDKFLEK